MGRIGFRAQRGGADDADAIGDSTPTTLRRLPCRVASAIHTVVPVRRAGLWVPAMPFNPRFQYSHSMVRDLGAIESARAVVCVLPLPPDRILWLRQDARQRATRNSTRIEGNTLNSVEIAEAVAAPLKSPTVMQQEVRNYWRALEWLEEHAEKNSAPSEEFIRELHCIIVVRGQGRRGRLSQYRTTECPVVDVVTRRIDYGPPAPADVAGLMKDLVAWWKGASTQELPAPIRAGLLAHRFVSIHPFDDGNGRTARALATAELWRSGYDMRGFLSLEEHYAANLAAYYDSDGRHDPDHTPWLGYFLGTMSRAAAHLQAEAMRLSPPNERPAPPWENLSRVQQQLLMRLLMRGINEGVASLAFTPGEVADWFGISGDTSREWLASWMTNGFARPMGEGTQRIRTYQLGTEWVDLLTRALQIAET